MGGRGKTLITETEHKKHKRMLIFYFSQLDEIDDKELPFVQSTPRASFGQKLLSCEELLNLSNVTIDLAAVCRTNEESTGECLLEKNFQT